MSGRSRGGVVCAALAVALVVGACTDGDDVSAPARSTSSSVTTSTTAEPDLAPADARLLTISDLGEGYTYLGADYEYEEPATDGPSACGHGLLSDSTRSAREAYGSGPANEVVEETLVDFSSAAEADRAFDRARLDPSCSSEGDSASDGPTRSVRVAGADEAFGFGIANQLDATGTLVARKGATIVVIDVHFHQAGFAEPIGTDQLGPIAIGTAVTGRPAAGGAS